jgi:hypothetical protein
VPKILKFIDVYILLSFLKDLDYVGIMMLGSAFAALEYV